MILKHLITDKWGDDGQALRAGNSSKINVPRARVALRGRKFSTVRGRKPTSLVL